MKVNQVNQDPFDMNEYGYNFQGQDQCSKPNKYYFPTSTLKARTNSLLGNTPTANTRNDCITEIPFLAI